jgi:hypothetical protein
VWRGAPLDQRTHSTALLAMCLAQLLVMEMELAEAPDAR